MKVKHLLGCVAVAATMASCSQEEINDHSLTDFVLKATVDNYALESRAGAESNGNFYWTQGDQLGVTTSNSTNRFTALTLQSEGGTGTGSFNGDIWGTIGEYAVYPFRSEHQMDNDGQLTYYFPDEYTYTKVDKTYFHTSDQGKANSFNFAMWGKIQNGSVAMKHLGGVFMVAFTSIPSEGTFTLSTNQKLNGNYTVSLGKTTPEITLSQQATDAEKTVTISFSGAENEQPGIFYVPAPTGNYTGVKATIRKTDGTLFKEVSCGDVTIVRKKGKILNFTNGVVSGTTAIDAEDVTEANTAFENEAVTSVKIAEVSEGATITIPQKASADLANVPHTINLSEATLPTSGNLTIEVKEATEGESKNTVKELTIVVPESTTSASVSNNLVINAPGTTVTIQTANGTVIETLEASTADNTLVVGKNVVINNLNVGKGNVKVYGKVGKITRKNSNTDPFTFIIKGDGSVTVPGNLGLSFKVVSAAEYELITKFKQGGTQTITLTQDVELSEPLTLNDENANITIDLGTYSLSNKTAADYDNCGETECYVFDIKKGTLNIKGNGSVNAIGDSDYNIAVFAEGTSKVNISGGTFTNNGDNGSDLIYAKDNALITITGGTFEATTNSKDAAATQNKRSALNLKDAHKTTASIVVKGGKFYEFNPAYNLSEGKGTDYVTEGYSSTLDNENYYVVSQGAASVQPWDGKTTQEPMLVSDVYTVETPAQLAWLSKKQGNGLTKSVILLNDINLGGHAIQQMRIISTDTFDGNGHTISNLEVKTTPNGIYATGLFGFETAKGNHHFTVKDLTIQNVTGKNNDKEQGYVGTIISDTQNGITAILQNVTVVQADLCGVQSVGGLVGYVASGSTVTIEGCTVKNSTLHNYAVDNESGFVAGLVGRPVGTVTVTSSKVENTTIDAFYAPRRGENSIAEVVGGQDKVTEATVTNVTIARKFIPLGAKIVSTMAELKAALPVRIGGSYVEGGTILLINDIDMTGWTSINGTYTNFVLDGAGHSLKNLSTPLYSYLGVGTYKVCNLNFENVNMSMSSTQLGGFAGALVAEIQANGGLTLNIENCNINNSQIHGYKYAGGFIGYSSNGNDENVAKIEILNSTINNATISTDDSSCGGLIGHDRAQILNITNCKVTGATTIKCAEDRKTESGNNGKAKAGYLVGTVNDGTTTIENCTIASSVKLENINADTHNEKAYVDRNEGGSIVEK